MAFKKKLLSANFSLANGNFGGGGNTASVSGLRMSAKIGMWSGPSMGQLELAIWGLSLSLMNQLSSTGRNVNIINKNSIVLMAGEEGGSMSEVFEGTIGAAWFDGTSMPDVAFRIQAFGGLIQAVQKTDAVSVEGSGDVATIMGQIAGTMGLKFENNGVDVKLSNPYLWGSARNQARSLAEAAGIQWTIDKGTLAVWKTGQARDGQTFMISPATGMVGYPTCTQSGIFVKTLFDPSLKQGGKINVQSDITPACGDWVATSVELDLESQVFNGNWFALITGTTIGDDTPP